MMKTKILIVAGATATGKSDVAAALALRLGGEIISADSMQIYRKMDIGTAKPTKEEMRGVKHWLVDEMWPDEPYSAAIFQDMARVRIADIVARGKIPIVCGGTGFYINALLYGTDFTETETDEALRAELASYAEANGQNALHMRLRDVDPDAADAIHANNVRRVIRALEYHAQTGLRISAHNTAQRAQRNRAAAYDADMFILTRERAVLYDRIDRRVDKMLAQGLIEEVRGLLDAGYTAGLPSMRGLGYKEVIRFLNGEYTQDEAVRVLKRDTRHFAKRQFTWFAHQADAAAETIYAGENVEETAAQILQRLGERQSDGSTGEQRGM